jgi:uncharacterized membrane protein (UPF0127 family)
MFENYSTIIFSSRDTVEIYMSRNLYIWLFVVVVAGVAGLFIYRTELPKTSSSIAEFGGVSLRIEYATTTAARERGLGGRTSIPSDYGMLFVFPKDDVYGFWMKDTLIPLDIFWLDAQGHVVSIAQDVATSSYPNVFYPTAPARYVLETVAGFTRVHSIATDTPLLLKNLERVSQ